MAAGAPGVAAHQARECEIAAGGGSVGLQRLQRIDGTGRLEAAGRTQPGAEQQPVALDQADEQRAHHAVARSNNCSSSPRTAVLSKSELALTNSLRSNPARRRT